MKKLIFLLTLSVLTTLVNATTYYVSPTGNDAAAGGISTPWRTVDHNLAAGDIMYVRGGTYVSTKANSASVHNMIQNLTGNALNPIKIWAYPGEQPIFSCENITPSSYANPINLYVLNCQYVHVKGIHVTYLKQIADGSGISHGITLWNSQHCTIELCEIDNIGGPGFTIESGSNDNYILNCDSHHNGDGLSSSQWDSSDGFDISTGGDFSTRNVLEGCRSWLNCDDGYDTFNSNALVTFKNCWAFWNGVKPWGPTNTQVTPSAMTTNDYTVWHNNASYISSSGEGFKLGPANSQNFSLLTRLVKNCVSFENRGTGYASNSLDALTAKHQLYNNIAFKNDNDGFSYGAGWSVGATQTMQNNWAWQNNVLMAGANFVYDGNSSANLSNNYWDNYYGAINYGNLKATIGQLTNADFISLSSVGADGPRKADGSLPDLTFLRLSPTSRLIDNGISVGIPYDGTSPDLGAYEYASGTVVLPKANAGADQNLKTPVSLTTLTGYSPGTSLSYLWTKLSGPSITITNSTSLTVSLSGLAEGKYEMEFKVTDGSGNISRDTAVITVTAGTINTTTKFIKTTADNIQIKWQADVTSNTISFEIERKTGFSYVKVATVPAVIGQKDYSVITGIITGMNQFRIRPVDKTGAGAYASLGTVKKN